MTIADIVLIAIAFLYFVAFVVACVLFEVLLGGNPWRDL